MRTFVFYQSRQRHRLRGLNLVYMQRSHIIFWAANPGEIQGKSAAQCRPETPATSWGCSHPSSRSSPSLRLQYGYPSGGTTPGSRARSRSFHPLHPAPCTMIHTQPHIIARPISSSLHRRAFLKRPQSINEGQVSDAAAAHIEPNHNCTQDA